MSNTNQKLALVGALAAAMALPGVSVGGAGDPEALERARERRIAERGASSVYFLERAEAKRARRNAKRLAQHRKSA